MYVEISRVFRSPGYCFLVLKQRSCYYGPRNTENAQACSAGLSDQVGETKILAGLDVAG